MGVLNITSRAYTTVMRSHTGRILSLSIDPWRRHIATVSEDHTIRVWDADTMQQVTVRSAALASYHCYTLLVYGYLSLFSAIVIKNDVCGCVPLDPFLIHVHVMQLCRTQFTFDGNSALLYVEFEHKQEVLDT